jgi:hypothetical protein
MCKGNMALFPAPPINTNTNPQVNADKPKKEADKIFFNSEDSGAVKLAIKVLKSNVPE